MSDLIYNRHARSRLTVHNPRPGQGMDLRSLWLTPELIQGLLWLERGEPPEALPAAIRRQLCDIGLLVPADRLAEPVYFEPELAAGWPALAPMGPPELPPESPPLSVATGLDLARPSPPQWPAGLLAPDAPVCWLPRRLYHELWLPWSPTPALRESLAGLADGRLLPGQLTPLEQAVLLSAGALQPSPGRAPGTSLPGPGGQPWDEFCHSARASIYAHGYAVIPGLLNPLQLAALRRYIRALGPAGYFEARSQQVPLRDIIHNHPLLQFLHLQLMPLLAGIVPEPLKASYSILGQYHGGAELHKHTDRQQCRWNVSLLLDAEPLEAAAWPLFIEYKGEARPVSLALGDLVLYSGTRTPHWRPPLGPDQEVAVAFFHFVTADYQGSLD